MRAEALRLMRNHRVRIGFTNINPSARAVMADNMSPQRRLKRVAARIRGVEVDAWREVVGAASEEPSRGVRVAAQLFRGREEIQGFWSDLSGQLAGINEMIAGLAADKESFWNFYLYLYTGIFISAIGSVGLLAFFPDMRFLLGGILTIATGVSEGVVRYMLSQDRPFASFPEKLERFLNREFLWRYEASNYRQDANHHDVYGKMLSPKARVEEIEKEIKGLNIDALDGFLTTAIVKTVLFADMKLEGEKVKPRHWLGVDRLFFWDEETGEPTLVMALRLNAGRPKYPQKETEPSQASVLSPVPSQPQD
jgi:hypothetical protein